MNRDSVYGVEDGKMGTRSLTKETFFFSEKITDMIMVVSSVRLKEQCRFFSVNFLGPSLNNYILVESSCLICVKTH